MIGGAHISQSTIGLLEQDDVAICWFPPLKNRIAPVHPFHGRRYPHVNLLSSEAPGAGVDYHTIPDESVHLP